MSFNMIPSQRLSDLCFTLYLFVLKQNLSLCQWPKCKVAPVECSHIRSGNLLDNPVFPQTGKRNGGVFLAVFQGVEAMTMQQEDFDNH